MGLGIVIDWIRDIAGNAGQVRCVARFELTCALVAQTSECCQDDQSSGDKSREKTSKDCFGGKRGG